MPRKLSEEEQLRMKVEMLYESLPPLSEELSEAELGDKALLKRFCAVVKMLGAAPQKSFPQMAGDDDAQLKGLYRFFQNSRVEDQVLFEPHAKATRGRAEEFEQMLVVHDTTCVCYGGQGRRKGLGRLNDGGHGYCLHCAIAVTADRFRIALGVLGYEVLVRSEEPKATNSHKDRQDPQRERLRWWRLVEKVRKLFAASLVQLIHVMDREADDYELLAKMLLAKERFVIRQRFDRLLEPSEGLPQQGAARKVREALAQAQVRFEREVTLSPRKRDRSGEKQKTYPARQGRIAQLCGAAMRLRLRRPADLRHSGLPEGIELNVVRVWEPQPPEGQAPVEWYLMTTEPIDTEEQILAVVDFYRARWVIEEYFKALKTGCSLEKRQLETKEALLNALAVFLPIAWHLLLLRSLAHVAPQLPASTVLSETHLLILRARPKLKLSEQPSVEEVLWAIAALGGHKKYNGPPGWQTLGAGFERLRALGEGWDLARSAFG